MTSTKTVVAGVLLASASSCGPCRPSTPLVPREPASSAVRAALTSIYYYALGVSRNDGPFEPVQVMGIVEAAGILRDAPSPAMDTYRRRAIGMLAMAGIPPSEPGGRWKPKEVARALVAIQAPIGPLTTEFLEQQELGPLTDAQKQWAAYEALNKTAGPWGRKCCSCLRNWDVDPDPNPKHDVAMAYFKIAVGRSYKDVSPLMDPQSWAACSPDFFKATWAIEKGKKAPCLSGSPCTVDVPPKASPAPNPNSIWSGTLFEHYRNAYASGTACKGLPGNHNEMYVRNVLRIEKSKNAANTKEQIDYGVCGPKQTGAPEGAIDSAVDCNCEVHGVDVDCGRTVVSERTTNPDTCVVEGTKHLKFSPRAIKYDLKKWAAAGLRMMIDEIVEEGVCCGVTGGVVTCPQCPKPTHDEGFTPPKIPLCAP